MATVFEKLKVVKFSKSLQLKDTVDLIHFCIRKFFAKQKLSAD
jgi:hypothetical protein